MYMDQIVLGRQASYVADLLAEAMFNAHSGDLLGAGINYAQAKREGESLTNELEVRAFQIARQAVYGGLQAANRARK